MSKPLLPHTETIQSDWVDYNGHMNVAYYVLIFDHATDVLLEHVGLNEDYRNLTRGSVFVVESHIIYENEILVGALVEVTTRILDVDDKRLHLFHSMREVESDRITATIEIMILHVNLKTRKSSPFANSIKVELSRILEKQRSAPTPPQAGRKIAIKRLKNE